MTTPPPLDVLHVAGSHAECGRQIGEFWADRIAAAAAFDGRTMPAGRSLDEQLSLAASYREVTQRELPWAVEELDGVAEGANVDPLAVFAGMVEEIWSEPRDLKIGKCSDLVAGPPATRDGRMLVAHNNDLEASAQEELLAIEWAVDGDPMVFTLGGGPWLSAGFNDRGIAFTGNELTPNDEVIGIPRQIQFRAMLREPTADGALAMALHPARASSYNNIITTARTVFNVEGSATDADVTNAGPGGWLAHTNHYACDRMLAYEGDAAYAEHSAIRLRRAQELLSAARIGTVDEDALRAMLSDHEHAPDSLCRHTEEPDGPKTVFWCIAEPAANVVTFGRGNPCDSQAQIYRFPT